MAEDEDPGPIQASVTIGGLSFAYTDWGGSGRPVVLIHGLRSSRYNWELVAPLLRQRWRVLALDMRGHGESEKPDHGYDVPSLSSDLHGFLTALDVTNPLLVGHSWGATVAAEYGATHPSVPCGLVFLDGGVAQPPPPPEAREEILDRFTESHIDGITLSELRKELWSMGQHMTPEAVNVLVRNFEARPDNTWGFRLRPANMRKVLIALLDHDLNALYPKLRIPVLFMPARDKGNPAAAESDTRKEKLVSEASKLIPVCKTVWVENSTHSVPTQHPGFIATALQAHIEDGFFGSEWQRDILDTAPAGN